MSKEFDTGEVFVHLLDMPASIQETVTPNPDGTYSIFINSRLSHDARLSALEHAMKHIGREDFHKEDVQEIEHHVHKEKTSQK